MTPSPDPPDRKRLSSDELIAVFVALTSIGAIFFWSISQKNGGIDLPFLQPLAESPTPAYTQSPAAFAPSASATPAISSKPPDNPTASTSPPPLVASPAPTPIPQVVPFIAAAPSPQVSTTPSPVMSPIPSVAPSATRQFSDVPAGFWASAPIAALTAKGILNGFPDGKFYPNRPITRVEFAAILQKAFNQPANRAPLKFSDLSANDPSIAAVNEATQTGFLNGFPDGKFAPDRQIPRLQVLLALATGLKLQPQASPDQLLSRYSDAGQIPKYAVNKIAAATEAGLVLNDLNPQTLNPNKIATRAEAAALIYKALAK